MKTLAIIVNYKTSSLALEAARSVVESDHIGVTRVAVVDNSESPAEEERLRAGLPGGVELLTPPANLGFGRACNLALERFPGDFVLLLNPDARLLPGCLLRLQKTLLARETAAAVGPQPFWDDEHRHLMPPSCPPSYFLFMPALASMGPDSAISRFLGAIWRRHAIRTWRSGAPMKVGNLSGGHVLLKKEALDHAGGLFDPRFFLYYEDTDLFMRLRKKGWSLLWEPRAEAIHKYDQSGLDDTGRKRRLAEEARDVFRGLHLTGWRFLAENFLTRFSSFSNGMPSFAGRGASGEKIASFSAPFRVEVPGAIRERWLFEWSPNPDFIPAVGRFGRGDRMDFTGDCWSMLAPGRYFGRLGRAGASGRIYRRFTWEKGKDRTRG